MADARVALPEPRPEDDEDVVWGLSTANALWARGEVQDALVWLRRAADAASAAGQTFRASELGLYITELEDSITQNPAPAQPAAHLDNDAADTVTDDMLGRRMTAGGEGPAPPHQAGTAQPRRDIDDDETLIRKLPRPKPPSAPPHQVLPEPLRIQPRPPSHAPPQGAMPSRPPSHPPPHPPAPHPP